MSEQDQKLLEVANQIRDHLSIIGTDYRYQVVNEAYAEAAGRTRQELVGMSVAELVGQGDFERLVKTKLDQCFAGQDVRFRFDFKYAGRPDRVYMDVTLLPHRDAAGKVVGAVVSARDVTVLKRIEDQYARLAYYDPATNLSNGLMFERELDRSLARAKRYENRFALLALCVDGISAIRDSHGEAAGDSLLKVAAMRIKGSIRQNDLAARLSGDEFLVLGEGVGDDSTILVLASRLSENLRSEYQLADEAFRFSVSIGVASYPADSDQRVDLMKQARGAMQRAKQSDRASIVFARETL